MLRISISAKENGSSWHQNGLKNIVLQSSVRYQNATTVGHARLAIVWFEPI